MQASSVVNTEPCRGRGCCEYISVHFAQAILDNSQSAYAQLLASASLIRLVTEHTIRCAS